MKEDTNTGQAAAGKIHGIAAVPDGFREAVESRPWSIKGQDDVYETIGHFTALASPFVAILGAPGFHYLEELLGTIAKRDLLPVHGTDRIYQELILGCTPIMKQICANGIAAGDKPDEYAGSFTRVLSGVLNDLALHNGDLSEDAVRDGVILVSCVRKIDRASKLRKVTMTLALKCGSPSVVASIIDSVSSQLDLSL